MSRSGYSEECSGWDLIRWRGAVMSGIRGKRGQQALIEIAAALDGLPEKSLACGALQTNEGEFCTLGALGKARGLRMDKIDPEDRESVARAFEISEALAAEIMFLNDDCVAAWKYDLVELCGPVRPGYPDYGMHKKQVQVPIKNESKHRWRYMREWVQANIRVVASI